MDHIAISVESDQTTDGSNRFQLFDQQLGNKKRFVMVQTGRLGAVCPFLVHLKDNAERILSTITLIPGRTINRYHTTDTIIQMTTACGQTLLTAGGTQRMLTVWSGSDVEYVGDLEIILTCCTANLRVTDAKGELLFQMGSTSAGFCGNPPSEFSLIANGVLLACIRRLGNGSADAEICLTNSRNFDSRTKAFLIFAGYFLYITYLAESYRGRTGHLGLAKIACCHIIICVVVMNLLVALIPVICLLHKEPF